MTLNQCWFNVEPSSTTLAQHWNNICSKSHVCWDILAENVRPWRVLILNGYIGHLYIVRTSPLENERVGSRVFPLQDTFYMIHWVIFYQLNLQFTWKKYSAVHRQKAVTAVTAFCLCTAEYFFQVNFPLLDIIPSCNQCDIIILNDIDLLKSEESKENKYVWIFYLKCYIKKYFFTHL